MRISGSTVLLGAHQGVSLQLIQAPQICIVPTRLTGMHTPPATRSTNTIQAVDSQFAQDFLREVEGISFQVPAPVGQPFMPAKVHPCKSIAGPPRSIRPTLRPATGSVLPWHSRATRSTKPRRDGSAGSFVRHRSGPGSLPLPQKLGALWLEGMPRQYLFDRLMNFRSGARGNDGHAQMHNMARAMPYASVFLNQS